MLTQKIEELDSWLYGQRVIVAFRIFWAEVDIFPQFCNRVHRRLTLVTRFDTESLNNFIGWEIDSLCAVCISCA